MTAAYHHTQKGPWHLLSYVLACACLVAMWLERERPVEALVFLGIGLLLTLVHSSFEYLTVEDEGEQLFVHFGPLPLLRTRIRYDDIREVEKGRTRFLDGWGVHWVPWHGWVWNIWGYDCVIIRRNRGTLRIGTDDPDGLAGFLKSRIAGGGEPAS